MSTKVFAVSSGKGGVGKTFITAGLGVTFAKQNQKVLIVDCDLSGANLHTHLGEKPSDKNLSLYLNESFPLSNLIFKSSVPNLDYISGVWNQWTHLEITQKQIKTLVQEVKELGYDIVLFDLSAGVLKSNLEFFAAVDEVLLVTDSEPTSVEKNYRLLEALICYSFKKSNPETFIQLQLCLKKYHQLPNKGLFSFKKYLLSNTGFSDEEVRKINSLKINFIVNAVRNSQDSDLGHSIRSVCNKFFNIKINYLGHIDHDNAAWQAVRGREIFLIERPYTHIAGQFMAITKELLNHDFDLKFFKAAV